MHCCNHGIVTLSCPLSRSCIARRSRHVMCAGLMHSCHTNYGVLLRLSAPPPHSREAAPCFGLVAPVRALSVLLPRSQPCFRQVQITTVDVASMISLPGLARCFAALCVAVGISCVMDSCTAAQQLWSPPLLLRRHRAPARRCLASAWLRRCVHL